MDQNKTAIERAFDLARSGRYTQVADIKRAVSDEGYPQAQLDGPSLRRQLAELIRGAKGQADR
jgi:hypothetical protein